MVRVPSKRIASKNIHPTYLGIEIGELTAWIALTGGAANPQRTWRTRFMTPPAPDAFFQRVAEGAGIVSDGRGIAGVGVASWAQASSLTPEWEDVSLPIRLEELLHAPTRVRAAVDAAALAEAQLGAGQGTASMAYVHLGREVLAALVHDGAQVITSHDQTMRIGHWQVAEDGLRCSCGATGHLNPLCSSQGFVRLAIGPAAQDDRALAAVTAATGGRVEALTAQRIVTLASAGATPLRNLTRRAAEALGVALARLTLAVNPEVIVLGGPLGIAGGLFIEWTGERINEVLRASSLSGQAPQLAAARLEPSSALTGAWLLGHEAFVKRSADDSEH